MDAARRSWWGGFYLLCRRNTKDRKKSLCPWDFGSTEWIAGGGRRWGLKPLKTTLCCLTLWKCQRQEMHVFYLNRWIISHIFPLSSVLCEPGQQHWCDQAGCAESQEPITTLCRDIPMSWGCLWATTLTQKQKCCSLQYLDLCPTQVTAK